MEKIKNHAAGAAHAHGIHVRVASGEEFEGDRPTGNFFVSVEFVQEVWTSPENDSNVSRIENRRIIGVSRGDAGRLYKDRKGRLGGQAYINVRSARRSLYEAAAAPEEAQRVILDRILSGEARALAHDVADEAAKIEVEMRDQLHADIAALS